MLNLDLNENITEIPRPIFSKLQKLLGDMRFYAREEDEATAKRVIAKHEKISMRNIAITNGSYHALELISEFFMTPADEMVVLTPTFPFYDKFEQYKKFKIRKVYYHGSTIDISAIINSITRQTKIVYLANPNNPIGTAFPPADLLILAKACARKNVYALIDEAYSEFNADSITSFVNKYRRLIVLRTFSKFWGLAGLKIGYIAAHPSLSGKLTAIRGPSFAISKLGLAVAETILRNARLAKKYKDAITASRCRMIDYCQKNKVPFFPSAANFITIKLKNCAHFAGFMSRRGFMVKTLDNYPDDKNKVLNNCVRITIAPPKKMAAFFTAFDKFLQC